MKNISFYKVPVMKIGQTFDEFKIMFDDMRSKSIQLAMDHPEWNNRIRQPTDEEFSERINKDGKIDMYLTNFRESKLERELFWQLNDYKPCVEYAYLLLNDLLDYDIKIEEDKKISKKVNKKEAWRSRKIDMVNVLKTYSAYRKAIEDAIKEINFKKIKYD